MNNQLLKENLLKLMSAHNHLTEKELSAASGVPQPTLNRILTAKTASPRQACLEKLANYFGLSITQMIEEELAPKTAATVTHVPLLNWNEVLSFLNEPTLITKQTTACDVPVHASAFALQVKDFSMSPLFPEKTILVFDPEKPIHDRGYGLFALNEKDIVFRQVIFNGAHLLIKALNPELTEFVRQLEKQDRLMASLVLAKMSFE